MGVEIDGGHAAAPAAYSIRDGKANPVAVASR